MPEMVFEYILKQHGMDPKTDLNIVQNIDFGSTAAAFSEGQADYTVEFEPGATSLETGPERICRSLLSEPTADTFLIPLSVPAKAISVNIQILFRDL